MIIIIIIIIIEKKAAKIVFSLYAKNRVPPPIHVLVSVPGLRVNIFQMTPYM